MLETAQPKELGKVDRAYILRWFIGEEADWNLYLRTHKVKRSSMCHCGCDSVEWSDPSVPFVDSGDDGGDVAWRDDGSAGRVAFEAYEVGQKICGKG